MKTSNFNLPLLAILTTLSQGCLQCITGGNLHIKKNYVSNVCGLVNGVYIREIKVDSLQNEVPARYTTTRSATLYKTLTAPKYKEAKRLYFDRDCKEVYLWDKNKKTGTTIKGPFIFTKNTWYLFNSADAHTDIFMFIDKSGDRQFKEISGKSGLTNF